MDLITGFCTNMEELSLARMGITKAGWWFSNEVSRIFVLIWKLRKSSPRLIYDKNPIVFKHEIRFESSADLHEPAELIFRVFQATNRSTSSTVPC